jgi:hypothetical protein
MADLSKLEEKYRAARKAYGGQRSGKAYDDYKAAKQAFAEARTAQRESENRAGLTVKEG